MNIPEKILNAVVVPRLNQLSPDIHFHHLRCKAGYLIIEATIRSRAEWYDCFYTVSVIDVRFDVNGRYLVLNYIEDFYHQTVPLGKKLFREAERFFNKSIGGSTLLMNKLKNTKDVHISENRITIQLSRLVEMYPMLQKVTVTGIQPQNGYLSLELQVPPDVSLPDMDWLQQLPDEDDETVEAEPNAKDARQGDGFGFAGGGELIVLEREHQRFYDRLRRKIEEYLRDRIGDAKSEKLAPYLLLAPDLFVLLARLLKDDRVSPKSKSIAMLAVAYFISPLDIIPEIFLGPLGFADDVVVSVMALNKILGDTDKEIIAEHWNGKENIIEVIRDVLAKADSLIGSGRLKMIKNLFTSKK
ncbi:YkvA family protein [Aneurinibacillus terranovensis]|uniref:YkvA family protein n=1 Tax=Aneurinibacillus terranovensis TaxID=278991 RepID=UPI000412BC8F|nr:YkvA family protein [Aneurinibacillus terranovensis]